MSRNGLFDYSGSGLSFAAKMVRVSRALIPAARPCPKTLFNCPNCGVVYRVVRAEAGPESMDRKITCRTCGGPLQGREGRFVLKYFLVERPRVQALGRRSG